MVGTPLHHLYLYCHIPYLEGHSYGEGDDRLFQPHIAPPATTATSDAYNGDYHETYRIARHFCAPGRGWWKTTLCWRGNEHGMTTDARRLIAACRHLTPHAYRWTTTGDAAVPWNLLQPVRSNAYVRLFTLAAYLSGYIAFACRVSSYTAGTLNLPLHITPGRRPRLGAGGDALDPTAPNDCSAAATNML